MDDTETHATAHDEAPPAPAGEPIATDVAAHASHADDAPADGQVVDVEQPPVQGAPDTHPGLRPAMANPSYPSPLDPDALSPTNATGYPTPVGNQPGVNSRYLPKPMSPTKAVLFGKIENMLHGVPADIENDEGRVMAWLMREYDEFHAKK